MNNSNIRRDPLPNNIIRSEVHQIGSESRQSIPGQKRIEYIPYEKTIIEYEPVTKIEYVPRERKVVEYYPVEYQTEYIPQVYHEKVIEYVPVERMEERVEYIPVERQIFYPPEEHPEFEGARHESIRHQSIKNQSIRHDIHARGVPIISSNYVPQGGLPIGTRINSSRAQPGSLINNMSFQNSGFYSPPPQDNSAYTKEPLPSSQRR